MFLYWRLDLTGLATFLLGTLQDGTGLTSLSIGARVLRPITALPSLLLPTFSSSGDPTLELVRLFFIYSHYKFIMEESRS